LALPIYYILIYAQLIYFNFNEHTTNILYCNVRTTQILHFRGRTTNILFLDKRTNFPLSLSLSLSLSLTHTHSLSLFFCVSLSMSLSLYLSHTLSLSFSPTTYIILYYIDINVRKVILASSNLRARHFCRLFQDYLPASYYILMCVK
jgi:hypothetical protein